jgi:oligosaccharyltransferase complex subunit beta
MGGNILVGLTPKTGEQMRDFLREFDVEVDSRNHRVFDDEHYISKLDDGAHDAISTKSIVAPKAIVDEIDAPILFRGISHQVGNVPLLSRVLVAEDGAYTGEVGDSKQDDRVVELVSAMQARNNARVTIAGSLDMFTDS